LDKPDVLQTHLAIFRSTLNGDDFKALQRTQNECERHSLGIVWTDEEVANFGQKGYTPPSVPLILPKLHTIVALYNNNIQEISTRPATNEPIDKKYSEVTNYILKYIQESNNYSQTDVQLLEDGMIYLAAAVETCIEQNHSNPFENYIKIKKIPQGQYFFDPLAKQYDMEDWAFYGYWDWVDYNNAVTDYPDQKKALSEYEHIQLDRATSQWFFFNKQFANLKYNGNFSRTNADLIDLDGYKLRKVVLYRRDYRKVYWLKATTVKTVMRMIDTPYTDEMGNIVNVVKEPVLDNGMPVGDSEVFYKVMKFDSKREMDLEIEAINESARQLAESIDDISVSVEFQTAEVKERFYHKTTTIGNVLVENEKYYYSCSPMQFYIPKLLGGSVTSPVVSGIEIEKQVNRWWTFADRSMWASTKMPLFIDTRKIADGQDIANRITQFNEVFYFDSQERPDFDIRNHVVRFPMDQINPQIFDQANRAIRMLDDVFAVPPVLQGKQQYADIPAEAQKMQNENASAVQTPWFEPMRVQKTLLAKSLIELIPQAYSLDQLRKIVGEELGAFVDEDYFEWLQNYQYNITLVDQPKTNSEATRQFLLTAQLMQDPVIGQMMISNPEVIKSYISTAPITQEMRDSILSGIDATMGQGLQAQPTGEPADA
jgi:hypothetical protein